MKKITNSLEETQAFVKEWIQTITETNDQAIVVGLYGNLGAGKTAFTKCLAKELGIEIPVTSPTFVITKEYEVPNKNFSKLIHVDAYRLSSIADIEAIGLGEKFNDSDCVTLIEWPEKIEGALPKDTIFINFEYIDEQTRKISFR